MLGVWYRLHGYSDLTGYRRYTLATLVASVAFGVAMIPFVQGPYAGLLESISVGFIIRWYAVTGAFVMRASFRRRQ